MATLEDHQYPYATSPDIIRSNQKDIYLQGALLEKLSEILRRLYGARFLHNYALEARTFTELLYLGCTTLLGNRTLGEEYCDIIQIEGETYKLPSIMRRGSYILSTVILPYVLARILPAFRTRIRLKLESDLRSGQSAEAKRSSVSRRVQSYLLKNLSTLTSPSPLYALGLSAFYFSGAYYHIGKRLLGLRYIFTKRIEPSDQRIGYEVLGFLLVLQMAVQGMLHLRSTVSRGLPTLANPLSITGGTAVVDGGLELSLDSAPLNNNHTILFESSIIRTAGTDGIERHTHTPVLKKPRYELQDEETMAWIHGKQQRKCTLCLDGLKDPSATTCGHVFCWTCITEWIREKPECPLCRSSIMSQHVLPLRG